MVHQSRQRFLSPILQGRIFVSVYLVTETFFERDRKMNWFEQLLQEVQEPQRRTISGSASIGWLVMDAQGRVLKRTADYDDAVLTADSRE